MTAFGWKRKRQLSNRVATIFNKEEEEGVVDDEKQEVDWLSAAKKRRAVLLEDSQTKSKRLQDEGALLAENKRYWEAIKYWDEAIQLTPGSAVLYEMKAQVLLELNEVFPAVEAAERAAKLTPTWSVVWQTLGRTQLGLGEIYMALSSAQKSLHLDPTNMEVRDDIKWIQDLIKEKEVMSEEIRYKEERERNSILEKRAMTHGGNSEH